MLLIPDKMSFPLFHDSSQTHDFMFMVLLLFMTHAFGIGELLSKTARLFVKASLCPVSL